MALSLEAQASELMVQRSTFIGLGAGHRFKAMELLTKVGQSKVEPVTTTLAAIALVKAGLSHANDLKDIAGGLDKLFHATENKPKKVKKKLPKTRTQQLLRMKAGDADYDDETSISAVANDILEQKKNERALSNLGVEIDNKFGKGTFELIKEERQKRLLIKAKNTEKAKVKAKHQKEEDDKFYDKIFGYLIEAGKLVLVLGVTALVVWLVWVNRCTEGSC